MLRFLTLAVVLCLAAVLSAPTAAPAQAPQYVWKAGTVTAGGNPLNDTMELFATRLAERIKGRINMDVHIANALAKGEGAHLEGVQLGTIDVVAIGSAPVGGMFEPLYQSLDLPFLWSSREQVWKGDGRAAGAGAPQEDGEQESATYVTMMKAMGANPVPMPHVEVYLAMKQGTIDGMELPSFTFTSDKKDIKAFRGLMRPPYEYVEGQVGK